MVSDTSINLHWEEKRLLTTILHLYTKLDSAETICNHMLPGWVNEAQFPLRRPAAVNEFLGDEAMAAPLGVFMRAVHAALVHTGRLVVVVRHERVVGETIIKPKQRS